MYYIIILAFLFFSCISNADVLWTKYNLPVTVKCISAQGDYIWLGTNSGLYKLNRISGDIKSFTVKNGLPSNIITSLCSEKNNLYIGLQDSSYTETNNIFYKRAYFYCLKNSSFVDYSEICGLKNPHYFKQYEYMVSEEIPIIKVENNIVYFCNNVTISPGSNDRYYEIYVYKYDISWNTIYSNHLIWGVNQNLSDLKIYNLIINPLTIITDKNKNELKDIIIDKYGSWSIFYDANYCEYSDGLTNINYSSVNSFIDGKINDIVVDKNNNKWFGCFNGSNILVKFDDINWLSFQANDWRIFNTIVQYLVVDDDNCIWIVTKYPTGLYRYNPNANTVVETEQTKTPAAFTLTAVYPNPFNANTTITFNLNKPGKINIAIYNLAGQKVRELATGNYNAVSYSVVWDGKNDSGNPVSSGVYLARMESGGVSKVVRMAMVK